MKRPLILSLVMIGFSILSCGPVSPTEAESEKANADSIAQAMVEKKLQEKREKVIVDSILKVCEKKIVELENSPEKLKQHLISIERSDPLEYLSVDYQLDFNLLSGKDVVQGIISNSAVMARYKDIYLEINCYSGTKTLIETVRITIYEYVRPRSKTDFEYKFRSPEETKRISVIIVGATPAD